MESFLTEWKQSKAIKKGVLIYAKASQVNLLEKIDFFLRGWEVPCRDYALNNKVMDIQVVNLTKHIRNYKD